MRGADGLKVWPGSKIAEAFAQLVEIGLIGGVDHAVLVAIDIVADHQEQVGLFPGDCLKRGGDRLFLVQA